MKTINVSLKQNSHKIIVGRNIYKDFGKKVKALNIGKDAIIITNPIIVKHHGKVLVQSLKKSGISVKVIEVPAGERSKSMRMAAKLIEQIAAYDVYKKPFVVAFGGGVIGDLAGYVAAAYKRGIPYVQVPTTFLAQIDSAIGGKVAVDLPVGKNLVGAFYQPKLIVTDVEVLSTLSDRQMRNGMAEAIKYGIIMDKPLFNYLEKNMIDVLSCEPAKLEKVVVDCVKDKVKVVLADEKETKGIRTILNFGHTLGHAIEAAGGYNAYHHGEAITLGMRAATFISRKSVGLSAKDSARINNILSSASLPEKLKNVSTPKILKLMRHDKKFVSGKNRFVLAKSIGKVVVKEGISLSRIKDSIKHCR